jgi:hypothetical protein
MKEKKKHIRVGEKTRCSICFKQILTHPFFFEKSKKMHVLCVYKRFGELKLRERQWSDFELREFDHLKELIDNKRE